MEVKHGRGYVYALEYHIVWCVKYRRRVLEGEVEEDLKAELSSIAESKGFSVEEVECDGDHVHVLVSASPQHSIPDMVKALKGVSARNLLRKHGDALRERLWGGHLWSPSYFVATVSENTEEQVRAYIQNQKKG